MRRLTLIGRVATVAIAVAMLWTVLGQPAWAAFQWAGGNTVVVEKNRTIEGDFYSWARTTIVDGVITGDLIVGGSTIVVNGRVEGSILALGENLTVSGPVGGNIRAVARSITLNSTVGKNVTIASESAQVGSSAVVGGGVMGGHANLEVLGTVKGDLLAGVQDLTLGGKIGGWVKADVRRMTVLPDARVDGPVTYRSPNEAHIPPSAQLRGGVKYEPAPRRETVNWRRAGLTIRVLWFVGVLLVGILLWLFYPTRMGQATTPQKENWSRGFLTGIIGLIVGPVVIFLAAATVVGIPVALVLLVIYLLGLLVTLPFSGSLVARHPGFLLP